jgi:hypothetical protein
MAVVCFKVSSIEDSPQLTLSMTLLRNGSSGCVSNIVSGIGDYRMLMFMTCSRAFAAAGYRVALIARNPQHLKNVVEEIAAKGADVSCDLRLL